MKDTVTCSFHAAKFILRTLASDIGKFGQPLLNEVPVTVPCPGVTGPLISVQ